MLIATNVFSLGWGMTELSPVGTMTPLTNEVLGSCGILLPQTEAKILDITTGESLPTGESGELVVRGPQVRLLFLITKLKFLPMSLVNKRIKIIKALGNTQRLTISEPKWPLSSSCLGHKLNAPRGHFGSPR